MDIFYFFAGGLVILIANLKMELLIEKESFKLLLGVSVVLFLVGVALHFTEAGRTSTSGALLAPLISLTLFRLCRRVFVGRYHREPKDTFLHWGDGLAADKVFNVVYFVSATWLWMLVTIGMEELAKAGW